MLGHLPALDAPDVDGAELDLPAGRLDAEECPVLRARVGAPPDDLVAAKDPIVDDKVQIGQRGVEAARAFDVRGKARRIAAGTLQVGFGEDLGERTRVMRIDRGDVAIQQG
jgi:hypothetical protein